MNTRKQWEREWMEEVWHAAALGDWQPQPDFAEHEDLWRDVMIRDVGLLVRGDQDYDETIPSALGIVVAVFAADFVEEDGGNPTAGYFWLWEVYFPSTGQTYTVPSGSLADEDTAVRNARRLGGFEVGDLVELRDVTGESEPLVGRLVPAEEVPDFMRCDPGTLTFNPATGHNDGPPRTDASQTTLFGLHVDDPRVVGALDGHPYPIRQGDISSGDLVHRSQIAW